MKDSFLKECDLVVASSSKLLIDGYDDNAAELLEEQAKRTVTEILSYINPASKNAAIFIVPALKVIAESFEENMEDPEKVLSEYLESYFALTVISEVSKVETEEEGK